MDFATISPLSKAPNKLILHFHEFQSINLFD